jgi:hypothetical protein
VNVLAVSYHVTNPMQTRVELVEQDGEFVARVDWIDPRQRRRGRAFVTREQFTELGEEMRGLVAQPASEKPVQAPVFRVEVVLDSLVPPVQFEAPHARDPRGHAGAIAARIWSFAEAQLDAPSWREEPKRRSLSSLYVIAFIVAFFGVAVALAMAARSC